MIIFVDGFCNPKGEARPYSDGVVLEELPKYVTGTVEIGLINPDDYITPIMGTSYARVARQPVSKMQSQPYQKYQLEQCVRQLTKELYRAEPVGVDYWIRNNGPINVWSFCKITAEQIRRRFNQDFTDSVNILEERLHTLLYSDSILTLLPCLWSELTTHDQERWRWMIDRATEYEKAGANIKVFPKAPNVEVLSQQLRDYIKERFETNG